MIIYELTEKERLSNHIPEVLWQVSRKEETYIRDEVTGELIRVMDLTDDSNVEGSVQMHVRDRKSEAKGG